MKRITATLLAASTLALGAVFGGVSLNGGVHLDNAQAGGIHLH